MNTHPRTRAAALGGGLATALLAGSATTMTASPAEAAASAPMAVAPYLYNGWGDPPSPTTITDATGVKW
ncbi:chitinase, partial [Streptomyces sp. NPDC101225]